MTGVSGSGKSTLAFDIVFAEGQRRFMESMSPYARQFVEQLPRPDIDQLSGIPPTVAIEQRVTRGSRKSTVATITEVAQYLRLLYARLGVQHHPDSDRPVEPFVCCPTETTAHPGARIAQSTKVQTPLPLCAVDSRSQGSPSTNCNLDCQTGLFVDACGWQFGCGGSIHQT